MISYDIQLGFGRKPQLRSQHSEAAAAAWCTHVHTNFRGVKSDVTLKEEICPCHPTSSGAYAPSAWSGQELEQQIHKHQLMQMACSLPVLA